MICLRSIMLNTVICIFHMWNKTICIFRCIAHIIFLNKKCLILISDIWVHVFHPHRNLTICSHFPHTPANLLHNQLGLAAIALNWLSPVSHVIKYASTSKDKLLYTLGPISSWSYQMKCHIICIYHHNFNIGHTLVGNKLVILITQM